MKEAHTDLLTERMGTVEGWGKESIEGEFRALGWS